MENNPVETMLDEAAASQPQPQPQQDDTLALRAHQLIAQAMTIRAVANVDVLSVYNTDPDARTRILSGEWDFIDLYRSMKPAPAAPAPVRSANGGAGTLNVGGMNDAQFARLNEMLSRGAKVDMRY